MISSCSFFSQENTQNDRAIVEADVPGQIPQGGQGAQGVKPGSGMAITPGSSGSNVRVTPVKPGRKVFSAAMNGPYVALTFDDGPHPVNTPRILDILNKYGAKATFYVLGERVQRHPSILARAVASGHEIGVHTWDHPSLTSISRDAVTSQMERSIAAISSATGGRKVRTMRPPYGAINSSLVDYFTNAYGLTTVMWNVDTNDWRRPGVSVVTSRAVNSAKSGSIILLHDIHGPSADAVEGIVKGLQERGFKIVTVSELLYRAYLESKQEEQEAQQQVTIASASLLGSTETSSTPINAQAPIFASQHAIETNAADIAQAPASVPTLTPAPAPAPVPAPAAIAPVSTAPDVIAPGMSGSF